jgi:hypothetical protein
MTSRISITVTSPKLLVKGKRDAIKAANPKTTVAPEAIRAAPMLAVVLCIAARGLAPSSFSALRHIIWVPFYNI